MNWEGGFRLPTSVRPVPCGQALHLLTSVSGHLQTFRPANFRVRFATETRHGRLGVHALVILGPQRPCELSRGTKRAP